MNNRIIKIDTNELRTNFTRYLKNNKGDTIYITRYNELVAEIKVYNNDTKLQTVLDITNRMVNDKEEEKIDLPKVKQLV